MQIVRTIIWVALLMVFVAFTMLNWDKALTVRIWPGIVWDTRLPAVVVVSFLLGLIPMWLIHRGSKWRLQRRVANLEVSARNAAMAVPPPVPAAVPASSPPDSPLTPAEPVDGAPKPKDEILK
jgi:lipopolysaccharide assembly protein A